MPYYDHIAKQWHAATGHRGGPFKQLVLNQALLERIPDIDGCSILELGAGNGYFMALVLRHCSGQRPADIVISDHSAKLLELAQRHFRIPDAEYRLLDVCRPFAFGDGRFDLILASMVFNEVPPRGLAHALAECRRVLSSRGRLLIAVTHPDFVESLRKRGELKRAPGGPLTMPGSGSLRLPIVIRHVQEYRGTLSACGFTFTEAELFPTEEVLNTKPGLRHLSRTPLALVFECTPRTDSLP
jgi:SAM-dependent methyltransferase